MLMHNSFRFHLLTLAGLVGLHVAATAQSAISILPADTEHEIIRKAASCTPSLRQFRWQQLELTAFFHFGINTFTDREWGDGKEDLSIFNPAHLDARQWIRTAKAAGKPFKLRRNFQCTPHAPASPRREKQRERQCGQIGVALLHQFATWPVLVSFASGLIVIVFADGPERPPIDAACGPSLQGR